MCCFSKPIEHVERTRILARGLANGGQRLAYQMRLGASQDLAMILPIPTPPSSVEDAVQFIDLSDYGSFFDDLERAFPQFVRPLARSGAGGSFPLPAVQTLVVHKVGDFEASFVPTLADMDRLDPRFRLPEGVWEQLPGYADFGFVVFKLRPGTSSLVQRVARAIGFRRTGLKDFHPMAFEFPRRDPGRLFLPTVHIHDGVVHPEAQFSHQLYVQPARGLGDSDHAWIPASRPVGETVDVERARGLIDAVAPAWTCSLHGAFPNVDTHVADA